ncbi:hypothetical protein RJT34_13514 [Clitoria ternatea]|uniref:DUF7026 domain-containing protein n=1 Tax=Clitoria ternatea TaxID=43366 RepID=A0AAN9JP29_CLITE
MALKIHVISPFFSNSRVTLFTHKQNTRISCSGGDGSGDASLASEFAAKAARMNAQSVEAEEAMRKSRKLLFGELCQYMGLKEEEAQQKWSKMSEEDKLVLVKAFVAEWGAHFHPLSARSTKQMLEDYLRLPPPPPSNSSFLTKIIGFP